MLLARDQPRGRRGGEQHEGEFAALRHQQGPLQRIGHARFEHARQNEDRPAFDRHVGDHADGDDLPVGRDGTNVERHPHREKEQPEQDAAERLDVGFELMAERRGRQQHACEKRAHRHAEPAELKEQRGTEHDQQRRRRHHLTSARIGEEAEHRIEDPPANEIERRDAPDRDEDADPHRRRGHDIAHGARRNQRHDCQ
jgi:hypothetical protein